MKLLTEEYLGGRVSFESDPERGTTFTVSVPGAGAS
jgi:signal transduction histidine kinase